MVIPERYPELDALRGIAVLGMMTYHFFFDLTFFYGYDIPVYTGTASALARSTGALFLLIVGICFVISWGATGRGDRLWKALKRGVIILSGGMMISAVTFVITPQAFVKFGVLHLIGVSALLQPVFWIFKKWNIAMGILFIFLGMMFAEQTVDSFLLFPLGLMYAGMQSLDYYPIFPWFGVILLGMALGEWLYRPVRHHFLLSIGSLAYPWWLIWCGRRALLLYFLHQPVILLLLGAVLGFPN